MNFAFFSLKMVDTQQRLCWKCLGTKQKTFKTIVKVCSVCQGFGQISLKSKPSNPYRPFKQPVNIGPPPKYDFYDQKLQPKTNEMLSGLCGNWVIYQHENGHRTTTDDYCCAAVAVDEVKSGLLNHLDLGTGLGTILNLIKWRFHDSLSFSMGVEAQLANYQLAAKTTEFNFGSDGCKLVHSDLRDLDCSQLEKFDLITGTPPYFRNTTGSFPVENGRKMCAFEVNGGIKDYLLLASKLLASEGKFVVANTSLEIKRTEHSAKDCGLKLTRRVDFCGKAGKERLFSIFVFMLDNGVDMGCSIDVINIRNANGSYSQDYIDLTVPLGLPKIRK